MDSGAGLRWEARGVTDLLVRGGLPGFDQRSFVEFPDVVTREPNSLDLHFLRFRPCNVGFDSDTLGSDTDGSDTHGRTDSSGHPQPR